MTIEQWARQHRISCDALNELRQIMINSDYVPINDRFSTEAHVQNELRIQASCAGWRLWRNNRGAGKMENGNYVRFGLANDSVAMNKKIKSSDLIGIRPILITAGHVGLTIGQFISREVKVSGWRFSEFSEHDTAQLRWIELINALGGDAKFSTGELL